MAMSDISAIESALRGVLDPELGTDIVELGMVKGIDVAEGIATIKVALTIAACPMPQTSRRAGFRVGTTESSPIPRR